MANLHLHSLAVSLTHFVQATETQSAQHIDPLHWHLAERLVLECGFRPEFIVPRPAFRVKDVGAGSRLRHELEFDPSAARPGQQTILGGLRTKNVDVVVSLPGLGPCLAVSLKGSLNAFRNLTNRMEEAAGDCTNIHMSYPALVYGFLHVFKGNREASVASRNDIAILNTGGVAEPILRYHDAMARLSGRRDLRDDVSRYEAISLLMAEGTGPLQGSMIAEFPATDSSLSFAWFFPRLLESYDLRFVYSAPALKGTTDRLEWTVGDDLLNLATSHGFQVRQ